VTGRACRGAGLGLFGPIKSSKFWYDSKSCAESDGDLVSGMSENDPEEPTDSSEDDKEDSDPSNKELKDSGDSLEWDLVGGW